MTDRDACIALNMIPGIACKRYRALQEHFHGIGNAVFIDHTDASKTIQNGAHTSRIFEIVIPLIFPVHFLQILFPAFIAKVCLYFFGKRFGLI